MSRRSSFRLFAGLLCLSLAGAGVAAERSRTFRTLHGIDSADPGLVARLEADLVAANELPFPEVVPFFRASAASILAEFPSMPGGYRAVLDGAHRAGSVLEVPREARAVYAHSYYLLTEAGDAFALDGPEVFPRVLRATLRRAGLSLLPYEGKLITLIAGLDAMASDPGMAPTPLHHLALEGLVAAGQARAGHPGAVRLSLVRGVVALYPEEGVDGRAAFLQAALQGSGENTPPAVARELLLRFADLGEASEFLSGTDRSVLGYLAQLARRMPDDAAAVQFLRTGFEGLAPGQA